MLKRCWFLCCALAVLASAAQAQDGGDAPGYDRTPFPRYSLNPQWRQVFAQENDAGGTQAAYVDLASVQFVDDQIAFVLKRTNARNKQPPYEVEIDHSVVKPQSRQVAYLVVQHFDGKGVFEQQQYADVGHWLDMDPEHNRLNAAVLAFLRGLPKPAPHTPD